MSSSTAPSYEAEHLSSIEITSDPERKVTRPEEAIIRLHEQAACKCLKPVKVTLRLEPSELCMVDRGDGYAIERLPYAALEPCQQLFVRSVNDRCPNLALVTVADSFEFAPSEFYVFQFANTSAVARDFILKLTEFKERSDKQSATDRQNPANQAEKSGATQLMEEQAQRTAHATLRYKKQSRGSSSEFFSGSNSPNTNNTPNTDSSPSVESQMMDNYLALLNKSLDDVEKFVERLQSAAEAYHKLEEKRRQNNQLSYHEENMLISQAKPPPPKDYFDIFQKIKFIFNLLAKLKGSIKNPTAAEMAHYIFGPLDLIVEASCAILGPDDQPLWEHVINPLLTQDAVTFLEFCLGSKEMELWRSLGSAWNISAVERDFWLNCVQEMPMYVPVFYDGSSPSTSQIVEVCPRLDRRVAQAPAAPQPLAKPVARHPTQSRADASSFGPADLQHAGLANRRSNSPQLPKTNVGSSPRWSPTYPLSPQRPPPNAPLSHPYQAENVDPQRDFLASLLAKGSKICVATRDKAAENSMELSVTEGQVLEVLETNRFNSKVRSAEGIIGYVHNNAVAPHALSNALFAESDSRNRRSYIEGDQSQKSALDNLNDELKKLKTNEAPIRKKPPRALPASVDITEQSSPEEVTQWLAHKGFSEPVQASLSQFGGKHLFVMDKTILEKLFGVETGARLFSNILLQKNRSGYKTVRAKELQFILAQRKKVADGPSSSLGGMFAVDASNSRNSHVHGGATAAEGQKGAFSEQF